MTTDTVAGWTLAVQIAAEGTAARYDTARYDVEKYGGPAGLPAWVPIPEVRGWDCDRGAEPAPVPGVIARAGRLKVDCWDPDRSLDPTINPGMAVGAPIRVTATKASDTRVLWAGTIRSVEADTLNGDTSIAAADLIAQVAGIPVVDLARDAETAPARIAGIMAAAMAEPPPLAVDGTGAWVLAPAVLSGDLWPVLAAVVQSDQASLWAGTDGAIHWAAAGRSTGDPIVVRDLWDGTAPVYVGLPTAHNDDLLINIVTATRVVPDGQAQAKVVHADGGSYSRYDPHPHTANNLQLSTDQDVADWAYRLFIRRAYPAAGPVAIRFTCHDDLDFAAATMDMLTGLDIARALTIELASRGAPQTWAGNVSRLRMSHDAGSGLFTVEAGLGNVETVGAGTVYDGPASLYDRGATYDDGMVTA